MPPELKPLNLKEKRKLNKPLLSPSRVFTITLHKEGIVHRINAMGYNIAIAETKLQLSQQVEAAFQQFRELKKYHT